MRQKSSTRFSLSFTSGPPSPAMVTSAKSPASVTFFIVGVLKVAIPVETFDWIYCWWIASFTAAMMLGLKD